MPNTTNRRNKNSKKISPLIQGQFPDFVQAEYSNFTEFVKAYYAWMDEDGNMSERASKLLDFRNIDESPDAFIEYLQNEFVDSLPIELSANKRLLIKNIEDFYKSRGTENSFKFLFSILYNIDVTLEVPKKQLLVLSDGNWVLEQSIRISNHFGFDWDNMVGNVITQGTITAYVDVVRYIWVGGAEVVELVLYEQNGVFVETTAIIGTYVESGDVITKTLWGTPQNGVSSISIIDAGLGYEQYDRLVIAGTCTGIGAAGYISKVGLLGNIEEIVITSPGISFLTLPTIAVTSNAGTGANFLATLGVEFNHPGFFANNNGALSSNTNVMQDSDYWQNFSYVIDYRAADDGTAPKTINTYKSVVKAAIHPAGNKMFGRTTIENDVSDTTASGPIDQIQRYNVFDTTSSSSSSGEATTLLETISD